MPRKVSEPAVQTISLKVTLREKKALKRLLELRQEDVRALTGRANMSGLLRLLATEGTK